MGILSDLEPSRVFYYFEEISKIPHGSGNTKAISDYLVNFAKEHELNYRQDKLNNVIIWKPGRGKPVIIQGHMDMVCETEPGCNKDMSKEGLDLYIDGDVVRARGTTLGGDDGVAVAMALAILESDDKELPAIEAIITVDEEIGMLGAADIDLEGVMGRTMLNIDSEDEGKFTVSCAGGTMAFSSIPVKREAIEINAGGTYELIIDGLVGGHSGVEIHKNRANAIELLGRTLTMLQDNVGIRLVDISGGAKDNAIAVSARAIFTVDQASHINCEGICDLCRTNEGSEPANELELVNETIKKISSHFSSEYATTDPGISVLCKLIDPARLLFNENSPSAGRLVTMSYESTNQVIRLLSCMPNGIQRMSPDVEGLVQTSLNMGILKSIREVMADNIIGEDSVMLTFCVRSSVESEKDAVMRKLRDLTTLLGGTIRFEGNYPGWKYAVDSPLRDLITDVFKDQYGYEPIVEAIHAGVECGYFASKLPGLDCVSYGPDLKDIHTYRESMNIKSVERVYKLTIETLRRLALL